MKLILLIVIIQQSLAFDLPATGCSADIKINNDHFNATDTYHTGDAYPTDAHYDVYGNLFYVESGKNDKGFYFDVKVIKFRTTAPEKITGEICIFNFIFFFVIGMQRIIPYLRSITS